MGPRPLARGWRDPSRQIRSRAWRKHDDAARPLCDLARYGSLDRARRRLGDRVPAGLAQMMISCPVATSADLIGSAAGPVPYHLDEESHRATGVIEFLPLRDLGTQHNPAGAAAHAREDPTRGPHPWDHPLVACPPPPEAHHTAPGDRVGRGDRDPERAPAAARPETQHIVRVLQHTHGKFRPAARILGVTRWSLARRLRKRSMRPFATEVPRPMGSAAHTRHEFQYPTEARRGE